MKSEFRDIETAPDRKSMLIIYVALAGFVYLYSNSILLIVLFTGFWLIFTLYMIPKKLESIRLSKLKELG